MNPFTEGQFAEEYRNCPFVYVDVGARGGIDRRWRAFKKHFQNVLFEADETAYQQLLAEVETDPTLKPICAALNDEPGTVEFHITRKGECSSLIPPNREVLDRFPDSARFDVVNTLKLPATTLDLALQENGISHIDFLKIDAQGSSLKILEGGRQTIASAFGVELETEFVPMYRGQALFSEVDRFMQSQGFELFDINRFYWKRPNAGMSGRRRGQLIFGDALYLRPPEAFVENLGTDARPKVVKATAVAMAYEYPDLAVSLWDRAVERSIVSIEERQRAVAYLERNGGLATWLARFIPARMKAAQVIHLMGDVMLRGTAYDCDGRLGNTPK